MLYVAKLCELLKKRFCLYSFYSICQPLNLLKHTSTDNPIFKQLFNFIDKDKVVNKKGNSRLDLGYKPLNDSIVSLACLDDRSDIVSKCKNMLTV